jgi:hypothetical protein
MFAGLFEFDGAGQPGVLKKNAAYDLCTLTAPLQPTTLSGGTILVEQIAITPFWQVEG